MGLKWGWFFWVLVCPLMVLARPTPTRIPTVITMVLPTPTATLPAEQKRLLDVALDWAHKNLKCKQYTQDQTLPDFDHPKWGPCSEIGGYFFGRFGPHEELGLILQVNGGNWFGSHGHFSENGRYIYCSLDGQSGKFTTQFFAEMDNASRAGLLKFPQGADMVEIADERAYTEASQASVYSVVHGEMKKVFTYDYQFTCHQCTGGFVVRLVPQVNRDLKLITLAYDQDIGAGHEIGYGELTAKVFEQAYTRNPLSGRYFAWGSKKEIPLVRGVFEYFRCFDGGDYCPNVEVFDNDEAIEEIIHYLKLPKTDPDNQFARAILSDLAGKDLGDDVSMWEAWKIQRATDAEIDRQKEDN